MTPGRDAHILPEAQVMADDRPGTGAAGGHDPTPGEAAMIGASEHLSDAAFRIVELRGCSFREAFLVIQAWEAMNG